MGTLYKKRLGDDAHPNHVFEIAQHYDYMNNEDYEFGGQSFGPSLLSRFDLGEQVGPQHAGGRPRRCSSGPSTPNTRRSPRSATASGCANTTTGRGWARRPRPRWPTAARPLLQAGYRFQWINVSNGSIYNNDQLGTSSSAEHYIQMAGLRLTLPIKGSFGIGADGTIFFRESRYSSASSRTSTSGTRRCACT